ncbi:MAG: hypothetical protein CMJ78_06295 [Planctomycetaceae bacterium]|nr:hypothetical protein [Planctomycetaceae bacterium]
MISIDAPSVVVILRDFGDQAQCGQFRFETNWIENRRSQSSQRKTPVALNLHLCVLRELP